jgi:nitrate reductase NapD
MNISSIVIQCTPEYVDELVNELKKGEIGEYQIHDNLGRIIVILEEDGVEGEVANLKALQAMPHVISADMVFSYSEDELERERDKLEKVESIPDWMNNPNATFKDINYNGDLKGRF